MEIEERNLSRTARRKMAQRAKKTAKKRAIRRKARAKKMKTRGQLKSAAEKLAKNILVKRMTGGKKYGQLSIGQKEMVDKKLSKKPGLIKKVARKVFPKIKAKEKDRIKKARASVNETLNDKHGIFTIKNDGGEFKLSARYLNGKLVPYRFTDKNKAKKHSDKVGGKVYETSNGGVFYIEFTKLDGPINEKSVSKSQQRLFGMVHAYNKGELDSSDVDDGLYNKIKKIAKGMTKKDTKKMAKTNHDDLPEKVPTNESKEQQEDLKDLKAILDVAKMLSDKSPYFKGRGSKKEYIKMLVHKIQKLSESKKQKLMTKMDAYKKVRKPVMPKSRPMKNKKAYDRKDLKRGKYD